jgi:hypothetical protein
MSPECSDVRTGDIVFLRVRALVKLFALNALLTDGSAEKRSVESSVGEGPGRNRREEKSLSERNEG